ncbi:MAG: nitrous oxide reductase accessory protein NosL [Nitrososphaerota archaeon]
MRRRFLLIVGGGLALTAVPAFLIASRLIVRNAWPSPLGRKCAYCGMVINSVNLSAYIQVDDDILYYDDLGCMLIHYLSFKRFIEPVQGVWPTAKLAAVAAHDYGTGYVIDAEEAWFVIDSDTPTPMKHGIVAFEKLDAALAHVMVHGGSLMGWDGVIQYLRQKLGGVEHERHVHDGQTHGDILGIGLESIGGRRFTLGEVLRGDRPVLLVFFATWCPTCSRNVSALSKIYPEIRGRIDVVLASFDPSETVGEIEGFLGRVDAPSEWLVAKPSIELLLAAHVVSQETVFLISPDGEILYEKRFGVLTEEQWLEVLLKYSHFQTALPL